ncbi:hypothetical protein LX36DRAFT_665072 [Colletotrichum falcatum]|nr:hypothetical protein LX36DRAFT_665072 [Colletotrichum falcatum]
MIALTWPVHARQWCVCVCVCVCDGHLFSRSASRKGGAKCRLSPSGARPPRDAAGLDERHVARSVSGPNRWLIKMTMTTTTTTKRGRLSQQQQRIEGRRISPSGRLLPA